ncbi:sigma-54-dependent transcriptional regulator [Roseovarius aestuarii]|uniref:C4-dicarboxylate transport transcriptional regulatory protein DctD n=1 Tax=Roseovarius aestuarii TaxID=475083 RepID=A0A1X7BW32_9RHOB|nr:response regulator [Roseovarius aestuarii]SMC13851.1 C4-dicarboxylate transport transcriptional regulatory protein DctD [Roseovarius aestuarii]
MTNTVLVVEDEPLVREALGQTLELAGYASILAGSFIVAKDHITTGFPGIVLSDIRMPGRDGLYLLDHVQSVDADLPVILLTGEGDIPMAVGAISKGAYDFLEKPCANEVLVDAVRKAMRARALVLENRALKSELTRGDAAARMIFGASDLVEALRDQVRRLAPIDDAVLIEGPPGSGIAKVAEVIHHLSRRPDGLYRRIAGAGLSPAALAEHLAAAATGTLFIEEVGAMPEAAQFALLEHLDAMQGARVLAGATETQDGPGIMSELNYRLDALRVRVPALGERTEDIPVIFRHYVREIAEQARVAVPEVTPEIIGGLMVQDWSGNTRALRNSAMRFVLGLEEPLGGETIGLADKMAQVERALIIEALVQHAGHASATARALKLPRKTFYDKLAKHGIKAEDYR